MRSRGQVERGDGVAERAAGVAARASARARGRRSARPPARRRCSRSAGSARPGSHASAAAAIALRRSRYWRVVDARVVVAEVDRDLAVVVRRDGRVELCLLEHPAASLIRSWSPPASALGLVPGERVVGLVEFSRERRQPQRLEGVPHDRELLGPPRAQRGLDEARLRPVRQAARVQGDHPDVHALARAELAVDVVDGLLGLDVRVVVGQRDRLRVVVELARAERADHEVLALEGLVHRRRHVDAAGDRLEVVGVERVRVDVAVPADDVERVVVEDVVLVAVAHADGQLGARRGRGGSAARCGGWKSRCEYGACSSSCP